MSGNRKLVLCFSLVAVVGLNACGGGMPSQESPILADFPASVATLADPNVVAITVSTGPGNNVNIPYVTVTVCVPGTKTCKTIDHVLLDTGSVGLRLFASVLDAAEPLTLPAHQIGGSSSISECAQFLSILAWGSVRLADVKIGAELAANVPIQVMDSDFPASLSDTCGSNPVIKLDEATPGNQQQFSANGILGVGTFVNDGQHYFKCTSDKTCLIASRSWEQVQNPVALFPVNNNGVVVHLPSLGDKGAATAKGYLIFGIATQTNNQLETATVIPLKYGSWAFTTIYKDRRFANSLIDSGSNGYFFPDTSLSTATCTVSADFYCPATAQSLSATIQLAGTTSMPVNPNGKTRIAVNFSIANADTLFSDSHFALNNLGGFTGSAGFVWGLPFFFGRSVFTAIEGKPVGELKGPFYAFTDLPY